MSFLGCVEGVAIVKIVEEFIFGEGDIMGKNRFIESSVDCYDFTKMNVDSLTWLKSVLMIIKNGEILGSKRVENNSSYIDYRVFG